MYFGNSRREYVWGKNKKNRFWSIGMISNMTFDAARSAILRSCIKFHQHFILRSSHSHSEPPYVHCVTPSNPYSTLTLNSTHQKSRNPQNTVCVSMVMMSSCPLDHVSEISNSLLLSLFSQVLNKTRVPGDAAIGHNISQIGLSYRNNTTQTSTFNVQPLPLTRDHKTEQNRIDSEHRKNSFITRLGGILLIYFH